MIQDIFPMVFHNEYMDKEPVEQSSIITFWEGQVLLAPGAEKSFPSRDEMGETEGEYRYLFRIDKQEYFLFLPVESVAVMGYTYQPVQEFREMRPRYAGFAVITAYQLWNWYADNKCCSRCGGSMEPDHKERMLRCPDCGLMVYPKISPAVIVAVTDGDRILLTKYVGREYKNYALIAGFAEIGESLEQVVEREVMEEAGLRVKNIRYYKSQPWALSGTLLAGFFAELDGSDRITMDEEELAEAVWVPRQDITMEDDSVSLTREMIRVFRERGDIS